MPVRTLVVVVAVLAASCSSADGFAPLEGPDDVEGVVTTTTVPRNLGAIPLPAVPGTTTTTVVVGPGSASLVGRIDGPDGPVGGAVVRVERLVGDAVATVDVPTAPDGNWNVMNVLGGRYRVRSWHREAGLAMAEPEIFFLGSTETRGLELKVERFAGTGVTAAVAPDPPEVDRQSNVVVLVSTRSIDEQGVVRSVPLPDVEVSLAGTGRWELVSTGTGFTDAEGRETFRVVCREAGQQPLSAVVGTTETFPLQLPACVDPVAPSTSTTADGRGPSTTGSTTSTTSRSGTTSTTQD